MGMKDIDKLDPADRPWMSNYPPLFAWVHGNNGRCLSQDLVADEFWERWLIGRGVALIIIRPHKQGWDIYTACESNRIDETLADAGARLGLGPK